MVENPRSLTLSNQVFPGISSVDSILNALGCDMAPGIQIYEASYLVSHKVSLKTDVACMLLQLSVFGSAYATYYLPRKGHLSLLEDYLKMFYPETHKIQLVNCQSSFEKPTYVLEISINQLSHLEGIQVFPSLYIPPLIHRDVDQSFLNKMNIPPQSRSFNE